MRVIRISILSAVLLLAYVAGGTRLANAQNAGAGTVIYGRTDMPDDFAYTVAKAMDEHQELLQWSNMNFFYDRNMVWKAYGVPLHPGAARYYKERAYMK